MLGFEIFHDHGFLEGEAMSFKEKTTKNSLAYEINNELGSLFGLEKIKLQ